MCVANVFGCASCNRHGKGRFSLCRYVRRADEKISESWESGRKVSPLLRDRFAKSEGGKMVTVWDSARMYGVTNVQSCQVAKDSLRPSHAKVIAKKKTMPV